jgi:hypothetical protein
LTIPVADDGRSRPHFATAFGTGAGAIALDSLALIDHPAGGFRISDFDRAKGLCFQGLSFRYRFQRRLSAIQKSDIKIATLVEVSTYNRGANT